MPPPASASTLRAQAAKLERAGDLAGALAAYEAALRQVPGDPDILAALAALAGRMGMHDVAAGLWNEVLRVAPDRLDAIDGAARALRDQGRFDEAVELLRTALLAHPQQAGLWNTLGVTLHQDSQAEVALTFLDEAIRLEPTLAAAVYNRGSARFDLGQLDAARDDFARARPLAKRPAEAAMIDFAAATLALTRGEIGAGWDAYEARFAPDWAGAVGFQAPGRRWTPGDDLAGKHLLVVAEQGLGDELMFANLLPDAVTALGPDGQLSLAVEPRLVELFARSFPTAQVGAHATDRSGPRPRRTVPTLAGGRPVDLWTPMGSLLRRFRRTLADFPAAGGYLEPDPAKVAHWRGWLGDGPPAVGVTWRSGKLAGDRRRQYPPLDLWTPLFATPGRRFVNLQYGDTTDEVAALRQTGAVELLQPPGLNLREDIEGLAALVAALDLTVAVSNATAALAGALGAPLVLIGAPAAWPRLGADRYPWYPQAEALAPDRFGDWGAVMAQAAARVAAL